jgi:hypothetical protein
MKTLLFYVTVLVSIQSCKYDCARSSGMRINFISFTTQEVNPFTIRKYSKNSDFSNLIDSLIADQNTIGYQWNNDTLKAVSLISTTKLLSDYDYQISIPATNSLYKITEINEPQLEGRKSTKKIMCLNQITSCRINGQFTIISYDNLYLRK